ncbi:hypothetical protein ATCC90586_002272 [Pythium insidiosum]|nr:hypothetical protein ATCC90586_002272 [Pythium insidiosum]
MRSRHRVRHHGCERPWAGAQIVAVLVVLLNTGVFFGFSVFEIQPRHLRLVALIIVSAQLFLVVALFLSGTRHCSVCHKCIADFDHHCVYLNTCIGSRNYPLFIALLASSIVLMATELAANVYGILKSRPRDQVRTIVISVLTVLPALQLISMLVLAVFHANLYFRGLRTYEWLRRWQQAAGSTAAPTPKKPREAAASQRDDAQVAPRSGDTTSDLEGDSDNPDYGGRTPVGEVADGPDSDDTRATDELV